MHRSQAPQWSSGNARSFLVMLLAACASSPGISDRTGGPDRGIPTDSGPETSGPDDVLDLGQEESSQDPGGPTDLRPEGPWDSGAGDLADPRTSTDSQEGPTPSGPVSPWIAGMCPLDGDPSEEHWDRLAAWGVRVVRQGFFWEWIGRPDGSWDFSWPDRYLERAERRNLQVLIVLDYDHPSLHGPGDPRPSVPPEALPRWLEYVRAVTQRYGSRAFGFEIWNEPNLPAFWKGTREDFVALLLATIPVIRQSAPGVPVAVAGFSLLPLDWLEALDRAGVLNQVDALSLHPYWVDAEGALEMVSLARDWLHSKGLDLGIWLTEYGWPTGGNYVTATSLDGQAERLVRFLTGAAMEGVEGAWWYTSLDWRDPEAVEDPDASEGFFGIAWPTAGDKPAAGAFQVLAEVLPGSWPDPELPERLALFPPLESRGFRRPDGSELVVITNPRPDPVPVVLPPTYRPIWPPAASFDGRWVLEGGRTLVASGPSSAEP